MTKKRISMPLASTKYWVENFVLRHNLCPFAHQPHNDDRIRYHLSTESELVDVVMEFISEIDILDNDHAQTTLIVYPDLFKTFEDYLNLIDLLEMVLKDNSRDQHYQIASFHPDYQFSETDPDDPANRTNRSPFPLVHILRCSDVKNAIEEHPDTMTIPERNILLMLSIFG